MTSGDPSIRSSVALGNSLQAVRAVRVHDAPFRILVIGDLGAAKPFATPVSIDRDALDDVIRGLTVRIPVQLWAGGPTIEIPIGEFDDFHPDALFRTLPIFEALRIRLRRLQDETTCREEIDAMMITCG